MSALRRKSGKRMIGDEKKKDHAKKGGENAITQIGKFNFTNLPTSNENERKEKQTKKRNEKIGGANVEKAKKKAYAAMRAVTQSDLWKCTNLINEMWYCLW